MSSYYKYLVEYVKIFTYGIICPTIISLGIYYTFNVGLKQSLKEIGKEVINETIENTIKKSIRETFNIGFTAGTLLNDTIFVV